MARRFVSLCVALLVSATGVGQGQSRGDIPSGQASVVHVRLDDQSITPATVRFMQRALRQAANSDAECLVIELNTPGGLSQSTQEFVTDILSSKVPVVVYVSPSGARAASAGVFITLASHVSAMAPGTRIGAAHPVEIGGLPFSPPQMPAQPTQETDTADDDSSDDDKPAAAEQKLINDTVAWAKSLAKLRNRNEQWAALAVTESSVLMASEAVQQHVVDLEATDLRDLLRQIDGREILVQRGAGVPTKKSLRTAEASVDEVEMWGGESLLAVISNPIVALLLLLFGVYGIIF